MPKEIPKKCGAGAKFFRHFFGKWPQNPPKFHFLPRFDPFRNDTFINSLVNFNINGFIPHICMDTKSLGGQEVAWGRGQLPPPPKRRAWPDFFVGDIHDFFVFKFC